MVEQAHRLHERVNGGWADEGPAALLQVTTHGDRFGRSRLRESLPSHRAAAFGRFGGGRVSPDIAGQRTFLLDQFDGAPGVVDG